MIAIDIEMPKSCYECKFKVRVFSNLCCCLFNEKSSNYAWEEEGLKDHRLETCPLKEKGEEG